LKPYPNRVSNPVRVYPASPANKKTKVGKISLTQSKSEIFFCIFVPYFLKVRLMEIKMKLILAIGAGSSID
jgi:hypothetical protein